LFCHHRSGFLFDETMLLPLLLASCAWRVSRDIRAP
jgi:hypothetical protein